MFALNPAKCTPRAHAPLPPTLPHSLFSYIKPYAMAATPLPHAFTEWIVALEESNHTSFLLHGGANTGVQIIGTKLMDFSKSRVSS
jgi:hypothetical protein